jgi:hypothetical protein
MTDGIRLSETSDINRAIRLITSGRLFEFQEWLKEESNTAELSSKEWQKLLSRAVLSGFHSMVEVLLAGREWTAADIRPALWKSQVKRRSDLAQLLLNAGGNLDSFDFRSACRFMDLDFMERLLRAGSDPSRDNAFAKALDEHRAKPLLKFFLNMREKFPALEAQAAFALGAAVDARDLRWVCLLRWAGADPLHPIPFDWNHEWDDTEMLTTAASKACRRGFERIFDSLKIEPNAAQAVSLLDEGTWQASPHVFSKLLAFVPRDAINDSPRGSSKALEGLIRQSYGLFDFERDPKEHQEAFALECIRLLLAAGARWAPDLETIRDTRRGIGGNNERYVTEVIRLLLSTDGACDYGAFWEVCRTDKMRRLIRATDKALWTRIVNACDPPAVSRSHAT